MSVRIHPPITEQRRPGPRGRQAGFRSTALPLAGIVAALLGLSLIAWGSYRSLERQQEQAALVEHTHVVLDTLDQVYDRLREAQTASRMFATLGEARLAEDYGFYRQGVQAAMEALRMRIADNPQQLRNHASLAALVDAHVATLERGIALRRAGRELPARDAVIGEASQRGMDAVRASIAIMRGEENRLLRQRTEAVERSTRETKLLIVFGSLAACATVLGALWMLWRARLQRQQSEDELARAHAALERHAAELELSNRELESFSYSISHDLRVPLRAVAGYARMLAEDYGPGLDGEGRRLIGVIQDNSRRMGELIDDLLAFSRLGRREIAAVDVDMRALAEEVLHELRAAGEGLRAQVVIGAMPPARGDRALLHQVWLNLLSNALKYSATRDPPVVEASGEQCGGELVYRVKDNGVGFDMAYRDQLFRVFQRLHGNEEFPGTGVGLAIVQRIVVRHGGRVGAEGRPGEGACFCFALPRINHD